MAASGTELLGADDYNPSAWTALDGSSSRSFITHGEGGLIHDQLMRIQGVSDAGDKDTGVAAQENFPIGFVGNEVTISGRYRASGYSAPTRLSAGIVYRDPALGLQNSERVFVDVGVVSSTSFQAFSVTLRLEEKTANFCVAFFMTDIENSGGASYVEIADIQAFSNYYPFWETLDSTKFSQTSAPDEVVKASMEGGWKVTRPKFTKRAPREFRMGMSDVSEEQKQCFQRQYGAMVGSASDFTSFTHPTTGESFKARFKPGAVPTYRYRGAGIYPRWDISNIILEETD